MSPAFAVVDEDGIVVNVIDAPDEGIAHACALVHPASLRHGTKAGVRAHGPIDGHPIGRGWHTDDGVTWHDRRPMPEHLQDDPQIRPHPDVTLG